MTNYSRITPLILLAIMISSVSAALAVVVVTAREPEADRVAAPGKPLGECDSPAIREDLRLLQQSVSELVRLVKDKGSPVESEARGHDARHLACPELPTREPGISHLPPGDYERVVSAVDRWEEDDGFRREWLFRSSREVLSWFGAPGEVIAGGDGQEYWQYEVPNAFGHPYLLFHHGRLIKIADH